MPHSPIIILVDGTAYYPGHDDEPGGGENPGGKDAMELPRVTRWVELDVGAEKFEKEVKKLIEKGQKT